MQEHDPTNELHTQIQYRLIEKLTESERRVVEHHEQTGEWLTQAQLEDTPSSP